MPKKNTPNGHLFEQYQREYRRITDAIRENKKLGYIFPEEYKPIKPSKVKNLTPEIVGEMSNTTPRDLRLKSTYVDKSSGLSYEGVDYVVSHHKAKPSQAQVKPLKRSKNTFTPKYDTSLHSSIDRPDDIIPPQDTSLNLDIINRINSLIADFEPPNNRTQTFIFRKTMNHANIQIHWEEALATEGEYEVAYRLENSADEFYALCEKLLYDSNSESDDQFMLSQFVTMLTGRALSAWEADEYDSRAAVIANDVIRGFNG